MYPTPQRVGGGARRSGPAMPLILCEYSHAMGNSNGGLKEYWDIFYSGGNAQGAFVWDWVDQGLWLPVPAEYQASVGAVDASSRTAAGGKTRSGVRNDNNFVMNGLVAGDRDAAPRRSGRSSTSTATCTRRRWTSPRARSG